MREAKSSYLFELERMSTYYNDVISDYYLTSHYRG
jgi:hypothetical protein